MVLSCQVEQDISDAVDALIKARSPAQVQRVLFVFRALPVAVYEAHMSLLSTAAPGGPAAGPFSSGSATLYIPHHQDARL